MSEQAAEQGIGALVEYQKPRVDAETVAVHINIHGMAMSTQTMLCLEQCHLMMLAEQIG